MAPASQAASQKFYCLIEIAVVAYAVQRSDVDAANLEVVKHTAAAAAEDSMLRRAARQISTLQQLLLLLLLTMIVWLVQHRTAQVSPHSPAAAAAAAAAKLVRIACLVHNNAVQCSTAIPTLQPGAHTVQLLMQLLLITIAWLVQRNAEHWCSTGKPIFTCCCCCCCCSVGQECTGLCMTMQCNAAQVSPRLPAAAAECQRIACPVCKGGSAEQHNAMRVGTKVKHGVRY